MHRPPDIARDSHGRMVLGSGMPNTPKPVSPPLFTPSTLPQPAALDPVVAFIEDALLAIANRQDEPQIPDVGKPKQPRVATEP